MSAHGPAPTACGGFPTVTRPATPPGTDGSWNSSSWVGIDGTFGSTDVLQAGVQQSVDETGNAAYVAWYEWYVPPEARSLRPYVYQSNIENFPVGPGDEVVAAIEYGTSQGHVHFGNLSNGKYFTMAFSRARRMPASGNTVEWIMEAPNFGEPPNGGRRPFLVSPRSSSRRTSAPAPAGR